MKKIYIISLLGLALLLGGCQTMETMPSASTAISKFPVHIVSEPSGAKVEVNDNYVGMTPLTIELDGWAATRTFARSHVIVAHPVYAGGQTQVKTFSGWYQPDLTYGDTIPEDMFFNMNLVRVPDKLDVNINKNK